MKFIAYILALYIILLSTMPCCAFDNCPDDKTKQAANHEQGEEGCGNCSPFFNCEGCATATIAFEPLSIEITPITAITVYSNYLQTSLPKGHYDFWQPPKLG